MTTDPFGHWLKQRRKALDLTQEELAQRVGCASETIRKFEASVRRPSKDTAQRLANALSLTPEEQTHFLKAARGVDQPLGLHPGQGVAAHSNADRTGDTAPDHSVPARSSGAIAERTGLHNAPLYRMAFIGRERERSSIRELLQRPDVGLVTLTGVGGTGKTRLALQVTAAIVDSFEDGVWFVNLAPISDPSLVVPTIAHALEVKERGGQPLLATLHAFLRDKRLLLVLDNFEQVLDAAHDVATLLAAAPASKLLVTSRVPLHLYDEHEFPVPPLALPDSRRPPEVAHLTQYEAVQLFIQRAQAVKPDFQVTNATGPAVAEICARLDGLPLAIELAAARSKLLPPHALLGRLRQRLKLLTDGARDLPTRQQTLWNTIDWSYRLLPPGEQRLFAQLSVFVGGCTFDAVEVLCTGQGSSADDVFGGVTALVDKNLLHQDVGSDDEPRLIMLETIREYAAQQLEARGETAQLRQCHAAYYVTLAERAETELAGTAAAPALDRLEREHDNLRAALQTFLHTGNVEMMLRLGGTLREFWSRRGHMREARGWLEAALAMGGIPRVLRPTFTAVKALRTAGTIAMIEGDFVQAQRHYQQAVDIAQICGQTAAIVPVLTNLGLAATLQGNADQAIVLLEQTLALCRRIGDTAGLAESLHILGMAVREQGDNARAAALFEESVALFRQTGHRMSLALVLRHVAVTLLFQGAAVRASAVFVEALEIARELGDRLVSIFCLEGLGWVAASQDEAERAARLWGAADRLREDGQAPLPPLLRRYHEATVRRVRAQLGEQASGAAHAAGHALSLEEAIDYALRDAG